MEKKITKNKMRCRSCGAVLESTFRHDFVECNCDNRSFVDGGLDYLRYGGVDMTLLEDLCEYEEVKSEYKKPVLSEPSSSAKERKAWPYPILLGADAHAELILKHGVLAQYYGCGKEVKYQMHNYKQYPSAFSCNKEMRCRITEKEYGLRLRFARLDAKENSLISVHGKSVFQAGYFKGKHNQREMARATQEYMDGLVELQGDVAFRLLERMINPEVDEPSTEEYRDALDDEFPLSKDTDNLWEC